jgi:hypothetical protein
LENELLQIDVETFRVAMRVEHGRSCRSETTEHVFDAEPFDGDLSERGEHLVELRGADAQPRFAFRSRDARRRGVRLARPLREIDQLADGVDRCERGGDDGG